MSLQVRSHPGPWREAGVAYRGRGETLYCESCGAPIKGRPYYALVDGVEMILCERCFEKLRRSGRAVPLPRPPTRSEGGRRRASPAAGPARRRAPTPPRPSRPLLEELELVEDYNERIRRAREARGWTLAALAQRLRISESMLRKIEQGKMRPSIDLARRIESVLRIQLLVPAEEYYEEYEEEAEDYPTLGDIVVVRRDEE